jgi:hypothetical protein
LIYFQFKNAKNILLEEVSVQYKRYFISPPGLTL